MDALIIAFGSAIAFVAAYAGYGRWLGRKIFRLSASAVCPSIRFRDDKDYVPTPKSIVFGHHFTSIAGTGPIVGPAIAILWGWVPALLWVVLGSIFIGAVHDLGTLVVSLRNDGQTVGDLAGRFLNRRVRLLFLLILFLSLTIVLAVFGLVIAAVFRQFPASIFPCLIQIPLAMAIGKWLHRQNRGLFIPSAVALLLMYASVFWGDWGPLHAFNIKLAALANIEWVIFLLVYSYAASVLPVWILLQPRDYINSLQLISALGLIAAGLVAAAFWGGATLEGGVRPPLEMAAPPIQWRPAGAPDMIPFLFITVACGAISGFHCLVSSGTSSKQLARETDATAVGYGSMLLEGFLAVLVIMACGAGVSLGIRSASGEMLAGAEAWNSLYASWTALAGLGAKVGAFVQGAANFLGALGLPREASVALMGVLVASFAGTTMDTACRLQRYVIQELAKSAAAGGTAPRFTISRLVSQFLMNRHGASMLAIASAGLIAAFPLPGRPWSWATAGSGGMVLWPMFGAMNQLLGGLAFLVVLFYLRRTGLPTWFVIGPAIFMLAMPFWAMFIQLFVGTAEAPSWIASRQWILVGIGSVTLALECWMISEAVLLLRHSKPSSIDGPATRS
ncbi:MAG: carbon starvation protein A [Kiritimatiellae bacterium]|nr:carbon starvation protein A [Kiritimatiellia bacterium]MDW8458584.1 carbon starvation CstA family protein [Verrucomicrobiota bacterium]